MKHLNDTNFSDRIANANAAKLARLAQFKPKPMVPSATPLDRAAEKAAEREAIRAARAAEREEARRIEADRRANDVAAKRAAIKERKALQAAEQKAARAARLASRSARYGA